MQSPPPELSLMQYLRDGGFEASLFTTYSVYLPFYEEVVLRRLRGGGCRHNVILVDSAQCAQSLAVPETRPRYAGRDYTLVPIQCGGAFHPKLVLLLGRTRSVIAVGSHNLTISGFGFNRELTNALEFNPKKDGAEVRFARSAWSAIRHWLQGGGSAVPREVHNAVSAMRNFAPWLEGEAAPSLDDPTFLAQWRGGPSLWSQLRPVLPASAKRVVIVGAFFDSRMRFVDEVHRNWPTAKVVLGIEPATVSMPVTAKERDWLDIRDATELYRNGGYLHAKGLYIDTGGAGDVLAVGSANPSTPAWLGAAGNVNDEAIVVRLGNVARAAARDLGLAAVPSLPKVTSKGLDRIAGNRKQQPASPDEMSRVVVAVAMDDGFALSIEAVPSIVRAIALDQKGAELATLGETHADTGRLILNATPAVVAATTTLLIWLRQRVAIRALVHHDAAIGELMRSSKQVQLRAALEGISSSTVDLVKLISAVEKVIFDDEAVYAHQPKASSSGNRSQTTSAVTRPESLAINVDETKQAKRHRRLLEAGDLGYLLDVLIRRLGIGLERATGDADSKGRTEEEQTGQDDDDDRRNEVASEADVPTIAKLVRAKGRNLVRRMNAQMKQAAERKSAAPVILLQLTAVLAMIRELRHVEKLPKWREAHQELVSQEFEEELLDGVLTYLFGRRFQLYRAIVESLGDERYEELARLKGLLVWLSWDCHIALDERFGYSEEPEDVERRVEDKAILLEFAQILLGDPLAREEATNSILQGSRAGEQPVAGRWLQNYFRFSERVEKCLGLAKKGGLSQTKAEPGTLAVLPSIPGLRLRVVSEVADSNIALVDFSEHDRKIRFEKNRVIALSS